MSGMPALQQSVYQTSVKGKGNAWYAIIASCIICIFIIHMMEEIREAIETGTFSEYKKNKLARMEAGLDE